MQEELWEAHAKQSSERCYRLEGDLSYARERLAAALEAAHEKETQERTTAKKKAEAEQAAGQREADLLGRLAEAKKARVQTPQLMPHTRPQLQV